MNKELTVYQRSKDFLWTNPYIAKKMLQAHLNPKNNAASRKENAIEKTIQWITENVPQGSSIIDFGCGPGLYAERLCKLGYKVTGVDISKNSIKYAKESAKEKHLAIDYFVKSYLQDKIAGTYDAAICIYCDFGALTPDEQIIFLHKVHCCLKPNGTFIFDVFNDNYSKVQKAGRNWTYSEKADFWSNKPHYVLSEKKYFEQEKTWGSRNILFVKKTVKEFITWDTLYDEKSISDLLGKNGFTVEKTNPNLLAAEGIGDDTVLFVKATRK